MQYALLIYENEAEAAARPADAHRTMMDEYLSFTRSIRESGHFLGGEPLAPTTTASTVRVREGRSLVTDGPFAETREALGGFYIIEAAHLDEALAIAARIPGARSGSIEVRPVPKYGPNT